MLPPVSVTGACGGECACSTCHVILMSPSAILETIEEPGEQENDLLDLAVGVTDSSRLGCQVRVHSRLDGLEVRLPGVTQDIAKQ